jgi:hypothetical protein
MARKFIGIMKIKKILSILAGLVLGGLLSFGLASFAQGGFWYPVGTELRPVVGTWNLQIPSLTSCDTIDTNASGTLACGTDAAGGSGFWATSTTGIYPTSDAYDLLVGNSATASAEFWFDVSAANLKITGNYDGTWSGNAIADAYIASSTDYLADTDTTYSATGTLLDLTGTLFSVNEGTLTDEAICEYELTGTQIECTLVKDSSGDCGAGNVCLGGHTHSQYLTENQSITLSGDVSGSGTTSITTTIGADKITEGMLKAVDAAVDEECLTYETTTGDFEWQACGGTGLWTDAGTFAYLTASSTDDLVLGSDATTTASFWFDISANTAYIGSGGAGDSVIDLYASGTHRWTLGMDDSDGDDFKIATSTDFASGVMLDIDYATGDMIIQGDLTITGDDLIMTTNTSGMLLIADGTNFNPTAMGGDATISSTGTLAIGADKITEAMLKAVDAAVDEECLTFESTTGDFEWQSCVSGAGDVTDVGDCSTGACFTAGGTGNNLYFEGATADAVETILTVEDPTTASKTVTLPNFTGYAVVDATKVTNIEGTGLSISAGTLNWSSTGLTWAGNAIGNTVGGTAQDSSGWTGFVKVSAGTWGTSSIDISSDTNLVAGTGITLTDDTLSVDLGTSIDISSETNLATSTGISLTNDTLGLILGEIDHDSLQNFVANEHIDHSTINIVAGTGLTGGGNLTASRTVSLSHLGIEGLSDPGADRILFWDDSATSTAWLVPGTGLSISTTNLNWSSSGLSWAGNAITDAYIASSTEYLADTDTTYTPGNDLDLSGTTFNIEGTLDFVSTINMSGTGTLNLVDVIDATTESTIEAAIDTLSNLTSVGTIGTGVWQGTAVGAAYGGTGLDTSGWTGFVKVSAGTWATSSIDISSDTNLAAGTNITLVGDTLNVDDAFLLNTGDIGTGVYDFGGATSIEIVNGATPVVDATGEVAIDTTSDYFYYYGASTKRVLSPRYEKCFSLETPSSTADDNVPIWSPNKAITITDMYCRTQGGTSTDVFLSDGTNALDTITCDGDGQADDGAIANAAFTANERMEFDIATVTGSVDWLNYCFTYTYDAD